MKYRLGIDVGGTNTDAVLIDEKLNVISQTKVPTTQDVYTGIMNAVRSVLDSCNVDKRDITMAMLGTTQCTNAIGRGTAYRRTCDNRYPAYDRLAGRFKEYCL